MEDWLRNWRLLALRGVIGILFGLIAFVFPGVTLAVLVAFFGAYACIDGAILLATGIRGSGGAGHRGLLAVEGLIGIAAGVITFLWPGITALALLYLIAAWAILTGFLEVAAAIRLRRVLRGAWLLGLSGAASVLLGMALVAIPILGFLIWIWSVGAYALASGMLLLLLAFRLRHHAQEGTLSRHAHP